MGRTDSDQIEHWVRPGKPIDSGISATWSAQANRGECEAQRFYVFSSNAAPLEAERSYTPFQLYQQLEWGGDAQQAAKALEAAGWATSDKPAPEVPPLDVLSLPALMSQEYRPLKWAIHPILPFGLCVLAGRPKSGKSILALNLAIAVADSSNALQRDDLQVEAGSVLYCALEDSYPRLQARLASMLEHLKLPASNRLDLTVNLNRLPAGLAQIQEWLGRKEAPRLVVIDVFARVKDPSKTGGTLYDVEYASLGQLQQFAQQAEIALILVHHTRKSESAQDKFDQISGSTAITGAADTNMILRRKTDAENQAVLEVTGRDVEDMEWELNLDTDSLGWVYTGPVISSQVAPRQEEVINLFRGVETTLTIKSMIESLGIKRNALNQLLWWMREKGILEQTGRGCYGLAAAHRVYNKHNKERKSSPNQASQLLCPS